MRFMSVRALRNETARLQRTVADENITLTSNGRPFAMVVGLGEYEDPTLLERALRRARAEEALSRIRRRAQETGTDRLTEDEIDAEIRASRAERRR